MTIDGRISVRRAYFSQRYCSESWRGKERLPAGPPLVLVLYREHASPELSLDSRPLSFIVAFRPEFYRAFAIASDAAVLRSRK